MDQIAGDDDPGGLILVGDCPQAIEIRCRFPFRHRNAAGAEGGGFAEVDIRHHEVTGFRQPDAGGGEEFDGSAGDFDAHGTKSDQDPGSVRTRPNVTQSNLADNGRYAKSKP